MLVFVGTSSGHQFHVVVPQDATLSDLNSAIEAHESLLSPGQYILFDQRPLLPHAPLHCQGITQYSCAHLYRMDELRAAEAERSEREARDREERGWYVAKDGKRRLRRKSRRKAGDGEGLPGCLALESKAGSLALVSTAVGRKSQSSRSSVSISPVYEPYARLR